MGLRSKVGSEPIDGGLLCRRLRHRGARADAPLRLRPVTLWLPATPSCGSSRTGPAGTKGAPPPLPADLALARSRTTQATRAPPTTRRPARPNARAWTSSRSPLRWPTMGAANRGLAWAASSIPSPVPRGARRPPLRGPTGRKIRGTLGMRTWACMELLAMEQFEGRARLCGLGRILGSGGGSRGSSRPRRGKGRRALRPRRARVVPSRGWPVLELAVTATQFRGSQVRRCLGRAYELGLLCQASARLWSPASGVRRLGGDL